MAAADVAFGEHPDPDATPPDVGHDQFAPSFESQAMAEEEARTAIQDAFEEAPSGLEEESLAAGGAAVAVAVAEPETERQPETDAAEDVEITAAAPSPSRSSRSLPMSPRPLSPIRARVVAEARGRRRRADEVAPDEPEASLHRWRDERLRPRPGRRRRLRKPAEPADAGGTAGSQAAENVHAGHEAEVEAEAIQEAFEEPMPAPEWSAPTPEGRAPCQRPASDDARNEPRAADDSPRTTAAAAAAFGRLEEFIAQPDLPEPAACPPRCPRIRSRWRSRSPRPYRAKRR